MGRENQKAAWWAAQIAKHGSEEAVRAVMRGYSVKSSKNKGGTGGFAMLAKKTPERFKEISSIGGKRGKRGKAIKPS